MNRGTTILEVRGGRMPLGSRTLLMGILNVTPDSFSDGGRYLDADRAVEHGLALIAEGADILDVGGESSRPGSMPVPEDEELRRVVPVVRALRERTGALISIDTTKASVARAAVEAGADIVNDISSFSADPLMAGTVAASGASVVIMHMKGTPKTMQEDPYYDDVTAEVYSFLAGKIEEAEKAGIPAERVIVDPGIGFGKTIEHNLTLMRDQDVFLGFGRPLLMGFSRKAFIGRVLGVPAEERLEGTIAAAVLSVVRGAHILRVHDVGAVARAVRLAEAVLGPNDAGKGGRGKAEERGTADVR